MVLSKILITNLNFFLYTDSDRFSREEFLKRITNTAHGYLRLTEI